MSSESLQPERIVAQRSRPGERLRERLDDSSGFTLIELLVVIIIIGILAAVAIPSFLSQTSKAQGAQAKELVHTAATAAETIATENDGNYENVTPTELHRVEPTIQTELGSGDAYVKSTTHGPDEYSITVMTRAEDEFILTRDSTGAAARTCVSLKSKTGCDGGSSGTW